MQTQLHVSSPFSTHAPITRTNYAVDAAADAGSSGRNAICDASRSMVITPHHPTRARRANAKYNAPIAMSARRHDAVLPGSSTRPRRTRSPVQSILNLQAVVEYLDSTHFFKFLRLTAPCLLCLLTVQLLLQIADSLEDIPSKTPAVRRRTVDDGSITY